MQRLKILSFVIITVVTLSAIVSATAFALPEVLDEKKEQAAQNFIGESGTLDLAKLNMKKFECTASTSEGHIEKGKPLGLFHIHFTGCSGLSGMSCTGEGDKEKEILILGTFHIIYDKLASEGSLGAAILFLIPRFHFTCSLLGAKVLMLIQGEVLCLIKPINTFAKHLEVVCEAGKEKGDPGETTYWNDKSEAIDVKNGLLGEENTGEFEMMSLVGSGLILTEVNVEIMA